MKRTMNFRKAKRRRQATRQLFLLAKELQDLAKTLRRPVVTFPAKEPVQEWNETDILSELYHGNYLPQSNLRRKDDPLDKKVHETINALYTTLSPKQQDLFLEYEAAANVSSADFAGRAYKDGFRLAFQLIWAGRLEPVEPE